MLKQITGAALAVLTLTGPSLAWDWTDIYIKRVAMAETGRQLCGIRNTKLVRRYRDRAEFFTGLSPAAIDGKVHFQRELITEKLVNRSAVHKFCARIRGRDF